MVSFGMEEDKTYYHCCSCGGIYGDKEKTRQILKIQVGTLPRVLQEFTISSGLCKICLDDIKEKKNE